MMKRLFAVLLVFSFAPIVITGCPGDDCKPRSQTYCSDGISYWADSCGEVGEQKELCECGCEADHSDCIESCCQPDCGDRECGPVPNGCGEDCGICESGFECNQQGRCQQECTPQCADRECGDDGCAGLCPPGCGANETCDAAGQCLSSAECVHDFGTGLTRSYGRLDGVLHYVVLPDDFQCPNDDDHVRLQVRANGQYYEVAVNVYSTGSADPTVSHHEVYADLVGGAWSEGWHTTGVDLDYSQDLDVGSSDFTGATLQQLCDLFDDEMASGDAVSIYMEAYDESGGHNVHRNDYFADGAIVLDPRVNPRYFLFRFANQVFCDRCEDGICDTDTGICHGACQPDCVGKECGDDGCDGSCGSCGNGLECNAQGQCVDQCTAHASRGCYPAEGEGADGVWFDSCGNPEEVIVDCPEYNSQCLLDGGLPACSCVGNWDYQQDCLFCLEGWGGPDCTEEVVVADWAFSAGDFIRSSPAIADDGTIYFASDDHVLYALNPDGTERWTYDAGTPIYAGPAIGADGTIYISPLDDRILAIEPDGTLDWEYTGLDTINTTPAIAADGTIYVGDYSGRVYAIGSDGAQEWIYTTGDSVFSSAAIALDGTVYVGSDDGGLHAINPDGSGKWVFWTGEFVRADPAIGNDGTIYIGSHDAFFYAINPDGTMRWRIDTPYVIDNSATTAEDGTIYLATKLEKKLYALNPDGSTKWEKELTSFEGYGAPPAVGADGKLYVGTWNHDLYSYDADGNEQWLFEAGGIIYHSPAMAADGTIYFGSSSFLGNHLNAVSTSSPGLMDSSWPKEHQNNKNTGRTASKAFAD